MEQSQTQTLVRSKPPQNSRVYSELRVPSSLAEREMTYYAALNLVALIDETLSRGTRHYRNKAGVLLTTLDEVVHAILADDLLLLEEPAETEVVWMAAEEFVA